MVKNVANARKRSRIREVMKNVADTEPEKGRVAPPTSFFTVSETGLHSRKLRKKAGLDSLNEPVPRAARVVFLDTMGGRAGVKREWVNCYLAI